MGVWLSGAEGGPRNDQAVYLAKVMSIMRVTKRYDEGLARHKVEKPIDTHLRGMLLHPPADYCLPR
jgi:hypothetical protein